MDEMTTINFCLQLALALELSWRFTAAHTAAVEKSVALKQGSKNGCVCRNWGHLGLLYCTQGWAKRPETIGPAIAPIPQARLSIPNPLAWFVLHEISNHPLSTESSKKKLLHPHYCFLHALPLFPGGDKW